MSAGYVRCTCALLHQLQTGPVVLLGVRVQLLHLAGMPIVFCFVGTVLSGVGAAWGQTLVDWLSHHSVPFMCAFPLQLQDSCELSEWC